MTRIRIAVIRVLSIENEELKNSHGRLIEKHFPLFSTSSYSIPDQPRGICDDKTKAQAIPKIIELGRSLALDFDGLFISCADDPGVRELRSQVSVPVSGAGKPTALFSLNLGERVGVIGISEEPPRAFIDVLGSKLVAYRKAKGISSTKGLDSELGHWAVLSAACSLQEESVDTLALACTGMSTIMIAPLLASETGLPVIDPVVTGGIFMYGQIIQYYQQKYCEG